MVDVEYQFTHPAGACFLCGGDVDRVRSPGDDTDGDATDPWDVPNNPWNVPNDPSMLGGPNGQLGNGRRRDYWMKYFRLGGSILGIPFNLLCAFALTIRVFAPIQSTSTQATKDLLFRLLA